MSAVTVSKSFCLVHSIELREILCTVFGYRSPNKLEHLKQEKNIVGGANRKFMLFI